MCTMIRKEITVPKLLLLTSMCGKKPICVCLLDHIHMVVELDPWLAAELSL